MEFIGKTPTGGYHYHKGLSSKQRQVMEFIDTYALSHPGMSRWVRHADIKPFLTYTPMQELVRAGLLEERNGEYRRANIPEGYYASSIPEF